ncbi:hypothetical protein A2U01_0057185, partial [Trifolium medium]|nr:hypothetical protein [Trifolium medium]
MTRKDMIAALKDTCKGEEEEDATGDDQEEDTDCSE